MIYKARDCIYQVSKSKQGRAILDLDFEAAFDYQVFDVLRAKGVAEEVIARIANIYQDSVTIPIVNNMLKQRNSLRQGCPGSMGWFGLAIDPLLVYLKNRLTGVPIVSLPTIGPCLENGSSPEPATEKYKVQGYPDDVKPSVSNIYEEFFRIIKDVKDNTPLNPLYMSVKMWYKFLVEKKVVMREIDEEGR